MRRKTKILHIVTSCLLLVFFSCAEDMSVIGDDFEIPELTDENTVQFTVEILSDSRELDISASGGRVAIDWGDGRLQKIANPNEGTILYAYGNCKNYRVRIWAEELESLSVGTYSLPVSDLHLGTMPRLKSLYLNFFTSTPELDIDNACPNLRNLTVNDMPDLERLKIGQCENLETLGLYELPKLPSLEIGNKPALRNFYCSSNPFISLPLTGAPNLNTVICENNARLSRLEFAEDASVSQLRIINCDFSKADFLKRLTHLIEFECDHNKLTELDLSGQYSLTFLDCSHNWLTRLDVEGTLIHNMNFSSNCLDESALNEVFESLPAVPHSDYSFFYISYYDNPGTGTCRSDIPLSKGWKVEWGGYN